MRKELKISEKSSVPNTTTNHTKIGNGNGKLSPFMVWKTWLSLYYYRYYCYPVLDFKGEGYHWSSFSKGWKKMFHTSWIRRGKYWKKLTSSLFTLIVAEFNVLGFLKGACHPCCYSFICLSFIHIFFPFISCQIVSWWTVTINRLHYCEYLKIPTVTVTAQCM